MQIEIHPVVRDIIAVCQQQPYPSKFHRYTTAKRLLVQAQCHGTFPSDSGNYAGAIKLLAEAFGV